MGIYSTAFQRGFQYSSPVSAELGHLDVDGVGHGVDDRRIGAAVAHLVFSERWSITRSRSWGAAIPDHAHTADGHRGGRCGVSWRRFHLARSRPPTRPPWGDR